MSLKEKVLKDLMNKLHMLPETMEAVEGEKKEEAPKSEASSEESEGSDEESGEVSDEDLALIKTKLENEEEDEA